MLRKVFRNSFFDCFIFSISIRSRLILYFTFLVTLPMLIISTTIYKKSADIITNKINTSLEEKLNLIAANIEQKFEYINGIFLEICLNSDMIRILSSEHPSETAEIISEMAVMDKILTNYSDYSTPQNLLIPKIYMLNRPEYLLYNFTDKVSDLSMIEKEKWYRNIISGERFTVVGLDKNNVSAAKINTIKIAKRLIGPDDMSLQFSGILTINIGVECFNSILNESKPTKGSSTFIVDNNQSIVVSPDVALLGKDISNESYIKKIFKSTAGQNDTFTVEINHDDILVAYKRIASLGWTILSLTPMAELNEELRSFNRIIAVVMLLCSILALIMALVLADNISYPIRKLVKSMSVVQNGNFDISLEYKRNDEFAYLFNTYKEMVRKIKELIDKLYITEVNKKEAELKSLQSQINPHFLYNTLDSINWMAKESNSTDISTMVTSLSDFFRYSLSKGKDIIPLGDELKQVESYLKIQKIRFQDRLDYSIEFPGELAVYLTVKLILQPLVENSIIHGINKIRGKGIITIKLEKIDSIIVIKISDNGAGSDIEELNSILDEKSASTSFAIKNVNDRIKRTFGNEYGIRYYDNGETGLTVIIRFPAVTKMEVKDV